MAQEYDLVILGGGTGGYVAAIRASQLGMKVAIVEADKLGGTCLHRGCIPSKALLRSAEIYRTLKKADEFGILADNISFDFNKVHERKNKIIETLHQGVKTLMKKGNIDIYYGYGRILGPSIFSPLPGTISVEYGNGKENTMLIPKNVIIATGSRPSPLSGIDFDAHYILSSDELLEMKELPDSIVIVGGGVIGIEWASMLADFGVEVTVVENAKQILPSLDPDIAREVEKQMKRKGIRFIKSASIIAETIKKENGISMDIKTEENKESIQAEKMLLSVGRRANVNNIGLENTDIVIEQGFIQTSQFYQTKEAHIYAIGDCVGGHNLAHVASYEGIIAVEHIANQKPMILSENQIPACIYSHPEVATIGLTEKQAKENGLTIKVGKFPFKAIGKALIHGDADGFVKIIADKRTDDILGIHMVGTEVTELISEAGLATVLDATPWEISSTVHPHPSLSEIMGEAARAVDHIQIHG